ncbi:MAG: hypothetical protein U9Q16_00500 [Patescibacteria group bacterium]|nr:hypothetical protein [Patescibacteria group bacterium]
MSIDHYVVLVKPFVKRHYVKNFKKKYKGFWDITWSALEREFQNFDVLFERSIANIVVVAQDIKICKVEFRVAGTKYSRHGSGNRCIVALHSKTAQIVVLLIYHKSYLTGSGSETAKWKNIIKRNYSEYKNIL